MHGECTVNTRRIHGPGAMIAASVATNVAAIACETETSGNVGPGHWRDTALRILWKEEEREVFHTGTRIFSSYSFNINMLTERNI